MYSRSLKSVTIPDFLHFNLAFVKAKGRKRFLMLHTL